MAGGGGCVSKLNQQFAPSVYEVIMYVLFRVMCNTDFSDFDNSANPMMAGLIMLTIFFNSTLLIYFVILRIIIFCLHDTSHKSVVISLSVRRTFVLYPNRPRRKNPPGRNRFRECRCRFRRSSKLNL